MTFSLNYILIISLGLVTSASFSSIQFRRIFFNNKFPHLCEHVNKNDEINNNNKQNQVNNKQQKCQDFTRAFNLAQTLENEVKEEIEKKIYRTYLVKHIKSSILRDFITMRY